MTFKAKKRIKTVPSLEQMIIAITKDPAAYGVDRCILCDGPSVGVDVFTPHEEAAERFGVPDGKIRKFFFGVCDECFDRPDFTDVVEDKLAAQIASEPAHMQVIQ